jgi:iron-sulfur cluster repair protein YtfE (RIC family)
MDQPITDHLREEHEHVRDLLGQVEAASGEQRAELFRHLVAELVRHEVAEEEILRPVSKRIAGEEIAKARIEEESQAEELLKRLEKLDPGGPEFAEGFATLRADVEKHAFAEETEEFPLIEKGESPETLRRLATAYEAAKLAAPTHPHPSTPNTPAANLLVGPFATVADRARDAVRGAMKSVKG